MAKNQKIERQPSVVARIPPSTGPALGPSWTPHWKIAMYLPRSLGAAMSPTAPTPIEITEDPPVA